MIYFYTFMEWATKFELAIARSTGRNPDNIRQLKKELAHWSHQRDLYEVRHGQV
jgi:hypothetical protein